MSLCFIVPFVQTSHLSQEINPPLSNPTFGKNILMRLWVLSGYGQMFSKDY